ncbi:MAG: M23 family metallopeptidase [Crocinitomicaceae bacterium]|nr:M23 family metallopeptidase [Crocinitomicaceae bacterium]
MTWIRKSNYLKNQTPKSTVNSRDVGFYFLRGGKEYCFITSNPRIDIRIQNDWLSDQLKINSNAFDEDINKSSINDLIKSWGCLSEWDFQRPINNDVSWSMTSPFGWRDHPLEVGKKNFHTGIDISAAEGTSVYPIGAGKVVFAGLFGSFTTGYGRVVIVDHGSSIWNISSIGGSRERSEKNNISIHHFKRLSLYGHLSKIDTQIGTWVSINDCIGKVGTTGSSTGNHLHFELRTGTTKIKKSILNAFLTLKAIDPNKHLLSKYK